MRAYTVKVPPQWAGVDSARAQSYLRDFFIHPLALPADPGAGERVARLTLNERLVDALSRAAGDVPAVSLRRLLAARVRELPSTSVESRAGHRADSRSLPSSLGGDPPPDWEPQADPSWRARAWADLSAGYKARFRGDPAPAARVDSRAGALPARPVAVRRGALLGLWASIFLVVGVYLAIYFFGSKWSPVSSARVPGFPAWRPS